MSELVNPPSQEEEAIFEWYYNPDTKSWVKITKKNANGRMCRCCGCQCPCRCNCCKKICCTITYRHRKIE